MNHLPVTYSLLCTLRVLSQHETSKGDKSRALQRATEPFLVAAQAPETTEPSEAARHHPALR